ncbi:AMP-activated protein kinase [Chloropicon roscoffensis]|uniref:AMP-activated protein kinase n=1 Tax=Chloropicon roscoffensis TaxID=1461544 RepID=A0AAX4NY94_9CHLO
MGNAQGKYAPEGGEGPPQAGSSHGGSGPTVTAPISINPPQRTSPGARGSSVPGSPLTYGPQPLMEPFAVTHAASRNSSGQPPPQEFHGVAGWPQQGTLVPTVLIWSHGGDSVEVEGSWDNWTSRLTLLKSGKDFTVVKLLMPGVYQFKFIVDGTWKYAPDQSAIFDEMGNVNNVVEVQEYVPENIEGISSFDLPESPQSSYLNDRMTSEDFVKDPPLMPQHLNLTLLNVPQFVEAPATLPRPQHVILNHIYEETHKSNENTHVLGMTYRYKSKYVTTVLYKSK